MCDGIDRIADHGASTIAPHDLQNARVRHHRRRHYVRVAALWSKRRKDFAEVRRDTARYTEAVGAIGSHSTVAPDRDLNIRTKPGADDCVWTLSARERNTDSGRSR